MMVLCSIFSAWATVHTVNVSSFQFTPSSLTITAGDTVTWTNTGGTHNVNGSTSTFAGNPASFGSGSPAAAPWTYSYTFTQAGTYNYQCDPHAAMGMTGQITVNAASADLILTGVFDADLPGGIPKGVELYVVNNIPDLSVYGLGSANNGGGSDSVEFTFPAVSATANSLIYVTTDSTAFYNWFGFAPDFVEGNATNVNGDDAIELFSNGVVIDVFGDINTDGTGTAWEYDDSWAYRVSNTGPDGSTFVLTNWTFGGVDAFDTYTTNAGSNPPMPIGTYNMGTTGGNSRPGYSKITIDEATTNDANFVPDSINQMVELNGIVYSIDFDGNAGYSFYMYDHTGGINVFRSSDLSNYTSPTVGDSISVYGEILQFRGLTEIEPDSIRLESSGHSLMSPMVVSDLDEATEGEYIRLNGFVLTDPSQWPTSAGSANVDITNGTDTLTMRIDSDTDIDGTPAITDTFNVVGAGSQFTSNTPANDGYQIFPFGLSSFSIVPTVNRPGYPQATIAQVTSNGVNFVPDSINRMVELNGIVYSIDFDGNAGYSFYMYDNTGGINVFRSSDLSNYTSPAVGDSITVFGEILQFRGLTEIEPDSIRLESTGHSLVSPMVVSDLDESTEGEYIRLNGFWLVDASQWPSSTGSANVDITNGIDTLTMRIDSDSDIDGTPAPGGAFDVIGAGSQFTFNVPANDGYQIFPISLASFISRPATSAMYPYYDIADVTSVDANGEPDSTNVMTELRGVVHSIDFDGNNGYSLFMYDSTGGINVFNFNDVSGYSSPMQGDSISVFGDITDFNGLTEIFADSIVRWSTGISLKSPAVVTMLDESTEGEYIRMNNMMLVDPTQWPAAGNSANVDIYNSTDTVTMRIDSDTDIDGTLAPVTGFDVIGAGSQFDNSSPYDEGYQIMPSSMNDLLIAPPTNPTINFAKTSVIATEAAGTVTVDLLINPLNAMADTVYLSGMPGLGLDPTDGTITPAIDLTTGLIKLYVPANEDSVSISFSIIDDAVVESNETLFVSIDSLYGSTLVGPVDSFSLVITDNDAAAPGIPTYDIDDVKSVDANGVADSLNVYTKLHGVVYTDDFRSGAGFSFYMYDNTGGINVFNFNDVSGYQVERGDSIRVIGEIDQYNGLIELIPDSIVILDSNLTLKSPAVVSSFGETEESEYVRLNNFTLVNPANWQTSGSFNVNITDGTNTVAVRIESSAGFNGQPAPTGAFDIIGAVTQYDNSSPYTSGYQLLPRDTNDIIPVVATTPTVSFAAGALSVLEDTGMVTIEMPIAPKATTAGTVKVYVSNGAGVTAADYSLTPAAVNDTLTFSVAANDSVLSFDINVNDDLLMEGNEDVMFSIVSASSVNIGVPSATTVTIVDNDLPMYDIADVTTVDANGVADSLGVYCKLTGVVYTDDFDGNAGYSFYIYDNTGGINVYNFQDVNGYQPMRGDSIRVVGEIDQFNGLTELFVDTVSVLKTGVSLKTPAVVTDLDESTESEFIRMNDMRLVDATQWNPQGSGFNVDIYNATDTVEMRVDADIDLFNLPAPVGPFDVRGAGGQFDGSTPMLDNYQILPRDADDIIQNLAPLAITEVMASSNHGAQVGGDWFEIHNYGNDTIDIMNFSWDDNSNTPGAHTFTTSYEIAPDEYVIVLDEVQPDDTTWLNLWMQRANGLRVITKDMFGPIGFSSLNASGDTLYLYDDNGAMINSVYWEATDVVAGKSLQYDTLGMLSGASQAGVDGAYNSLAGDVGNPGNMTPVSLDELMFANLKLYPNPATDVVNLEISEKGEKSIRLNTVDGKVVRSMSVSGTKVEINTADLVPGLYLLSIEAEGKSATLKVVIR